MNTKKEYLSQENLERIAADPTYAVLEEILNERSSEGKIKVNDTLVVEPLPAKEESGTPFAVPTSTSPNVEVPVGEPSVFSVPTIEPVQPQVEEVNINNEVPNMNMTGNISVNPDPVIMPQVMPVQADLASNMAPSPQVETTENNIEVPVGEPSMFSVPTLEPVQPQVEEVNINNEVPNMNMTGNISVNPDPVIMPQVMPMTPNFGINPSPVVGQNINEADTQILPIMDNAEPIPAPFANPFEIPTINQNESPMPTTNIVNNGMPIQFGNIFGPPVEPTVGSMGTTEFFGGAMPDTNVNNPLPLNNETPFFNPMSTPNLQQAPQTLFGSMQENA